MFTELAQDMFKEVFGNGVFDSIAEILKLNPSSKLSSAWGTVGTIYNNVMVPIALGLMIIWFLVKIAEKATADHLTYQQFFMVFVKLIAAKFLIDNGFKIFADMWSLGISVIDQVSGAFRAPGAASVSYKELWKTFTGVTWGTKLGFGESLGYVFQFMLPWLAAKIMEACVYFVCYSRIIEMLLRICAAPIALSDFFSEGLHGAGWRYLKNFLAICLQGMLILCISKFYGHVMYDVFNGPPMGVWKTILMQLGVSFAAISLMFKSLTLSKELLGTS